MRELTKRTAEQQAVVDMYANRAIQMEVLARDLMAIMKAYDGTDMPPSEWEIPPDGYDDDFYDEHFGEVRMLESIADWLRDVVVLPLIGDPLIEGRPKPMPYSLASSKEQHS